MTHGEYIRSMTDKELAEVLPLCCCCSAFNKECDAKCTQHIEEWLGQEIGQETKDLPAGSIVDAAQHAP